MRCCLLGKIPQAHNINSEFFMPNATPPQFLKFFFHKDKNEAIDKLEPQISYYCEFFKHISSFCEPKHENILHILIFCRPKYQNIPHILIFWRPKYQNIPHVLVGMKFDLDVYGYILSNYDPIAILFSERERWIPQL